MTTLVGRAIKLGLVESIDQQVADFLPAFKGDPVGAVTIRQLMLHTSGIAFSKNLFNLNSDQVQFYYGKRLQHRMSKLELATLPGEIFDYHSANTQLLGMILSRVSGLSLSEYLETHIWQPLQMEYPAFWSLDRKDEQGTERAFCCLQANALDFSKLGRLWLFNGNWNGEQLLPEDWIATVLSLDHPQIGRYHAGLTTAGTFQYSQAFFASGLMGQIVYVVPNKQLLIVRFGEHRKGYSINLWRDVLSQVEEMF
jgi:CubicO group peptidase (beta-lactamase class C family)